jgi:hypothetical protein
VDQEVGGSSPPSCTSKINNLGQAMSGEEIVMSALCPHSHCWTRRPDGAHGGIQVGVRKEEWHSCHKSNQTKNDPVFIA